MASDSAYRLLFRLLWLFLVVALSAGLGRRLKRQGQGPRSRGVTFFGVVFVALAIDQLFGSLDFSYYRFMFQHLPVHLIRTRYLLSILSRLAVLGAGLGLLLLKPWARKGALLAGGFLLYGFPWKHSIVTFIHLAELADRNFPSAPPADPWAGYAFYVLLDIVFGAVLLFFFSRPAVKRQFDASGGFNNVQDS